MWAYGIWESWFGTKWSRECTLCFMVILSIPFLIWDEAKTFSITSFFLPPAFLYQEYRDTSKQQEIEQRRQRENLSPEVMSGTVAAESIVAYTPTIQLQLRNNARSLSLWQNLEAVQNSSLLRKLPQKEVIMQEVGSVFVMETIWNK